jgi:hypothetical protein
VKSDVDEELLFNIPFHGSVKLKSVIIVGGDGGSHPSKMRLLAYFIFFPQSSFKLSSCEFFVSEDLKTNLT